MRLVRCDGAQCVSASARQCMSDQDQLMSWEWEMTGRPAATKHKHVLLYVTVTGEERRCLNYLEMCNRLPPPHHPHHTAVSLSWVSCSVSSKQSITVTYWDPLPPPLTPPRPRHRAVDVRRVSADLTNTGQHHLILLYLFYTTAGLTDNITYISISWLLS